MRLGRNKARWIFSMDKYGSKRVCSKCGYSRLFKTYGRDFARYCEDCGREMVGYFVMGSPDGDDLRLSDIFRIYRETCPEAKGEKITEYEKRIAKRRASR